VQEEKEKGEKKRIVLPAKSIKGELMMEKKEKERGKKDRTKIHPRIRKGHLSRSYSRGRTLRKKKERGVKSSYNKSQLSKRREGEKGKSFCRFYRGRKERKWSRWGREPASPHGLLPFVCPSANGQRRRKGGAESTNCLSGHEKVGAGEKKEKESRNHQRE